MRIALCHGCFDVLHVGHIRLLRYARAVSDRLIVSVASDEHIRAHKGEQRPYNTLADRMEMLRSIRGVSEVICDVREPGIDDVIAMIAIRQPSIYVKGAEYSAANLPEMARCQSQGIRVMFVPMEPGRSTTRTLERMSA